MAFEPQPVGLSKISRSAGQSGSGLPEQYFKFFNSSIRSIVQGFLQSSSSSSEHGLRKQYGGNISRAARSISRPQSIQSVRVPCPFVPSAPPPPLPQASVSLSPPSRTKWGGTHTRLWEWGRGGGEPIQTKGQTLYGTLYTNPSLGSRLSRIIQDVRIQ
jgi:hypothetical protein